MGAQARKNFLTSRAASPESKALVTGGVQADLRTLKGEAKRRDSSSLLPHGLYILSSARPRVRALVEHKGVKEENTVPGATTPNTHPLLRADLAMAQSTTTTSLGSQSKVVVFTGLRHFNEKAPAPNKYKHRHLQLIMVVLISQISLQIACCNG